MIVKKFIIWYEQIGSWNKYIHLCTLALADLLSETSRAFS